MSAVCACAALLVAAAALVLVNLHRELKPPSLGSRCTRGPTAALRANVHAGEFPAAITTNHKTGTELAKCLVRLLADANISAHLAEMHVSAEHFSGNVRQVNLVRSPFILIHSGYNYHKSVAKPERWTVKPFEQMHFELDGVWQGALEAFTALPTCGSYIGVGNLSGSQTYRQALNELNLTAGLLFESLRALRRDLPYMLTSAHLCSRIGFRPQGRACTNIWLDELMLDLFEGGQNQAASDLFRTLLVPPDVSVKTRDCDPFAGPGRMHDHTTNHSGRDEAIHLLRRLDAAFLGGELALAEATLESYRPRPAKVEGGLARSYGSLSRSRMSSNGRARKI